MSRLRVTGGWRGITVIVVIAAVEAVTFLLLRQDRAPSLGAAPAYSRPARWTVARTEDGDRTLVLRDLTGRGDCERLAAMPATESADEVRTAINIVSPPPDGNYACTLALRVGGEVRVRLRRPLAGRTVVGPFHVEQAS